MLSGAVLAAAHSAVCACSSASRTISARSTLRGAHMARMRRDLRRRRPRAPRVLAIEPLLPLHPSCECPQNSYMQPPACLRTVSAALLSPVEGSLAKARGSRTSAPPARSRVTPSCSVKALSVLVSQREGVLPAVKQLRRAGAVHSPVVCTGRRTERVLTAADTTSEIPPHGQRPWAAYASLVRNGELS